MDIYSEDAKAECGGDFFEDGYGNARVFVQAFR